MPFKDDIRHLAGLKQQIWQKMILLVQHIALMSLTKNRLEKALTMGMLESKRGRSSTCYLASNQHASWVT